MRKLLFLMVALITGTGAFAQIESHVKWSYAAKKLNDKEAVVFLKATIDNGWHIYSQDIKDGGPIKTSFTFTPTKDYTVIGKTTAPLPLTKFEKTFNMKIGYYEKSVVFQQKIKLNSPKVATVKGKLEYMTCSDLKCLPPEDLDFTIPLGK